MTVSSKCLRAGVRDWRRTGKLEATKSEAGGMPGSDDLTVARMGTSRHTHVRLSGVARPLDHVTVAELRGHLVTLPYAAPVTSSLLGLGGVVL